MQQIEKILKVWYLLLCCVNRSLIQVKYNLIYSTCLHCVDFTSWRTCSSQCPLFKTHCNYFANWNTLQLLPILARYFFSIFLKYLTSTFQSALTNPAVFAIVMCDIIFNLEQLQRFIRWKLTESSFPLLNHWGKCI